jgi:amino acid transporter
LFRQLIRWILGEKLANAQIGEQKFSVFWGMPILSSDAISSVAYAVEEMLWILVPAVGMASYIWMPKIAGAIVLLLFILTLSYRQTVDAYPNGGGAYTVASTNLGHIPGLVAGTSLAVDYTLTVAVSMTAGVAAITSAFPAIFPYRVILAIILIILMVTGNLRGIKDASRIFGIPTYLFVFAVLALIVVGIIKHGTGAATQVPVQPGHVAFGTEMITIFLVLKAFSSGCSALTGVEAISNSVPNFRPPTQKNAKTTYILLATAVFTTFGGIAYLAKLYQTIPDAHITVIAQLAIAIFGKGGMFYFIQAATAIILVMAANTAFTDFPILLSLIAQDGYAPRQLALRGHRLNFSNGIITLAGLAIVLVVVFQGDTHLLIPLYSVGVFTSFTLSQTGMLFHWLRLKPEGWLHRAFINGLGALVTLISVVIIGTNKFRAGAWIVLLIIPIVVIIMMRVKKHYVSVAQQLDIPNESLGLISFEPRYSHFVIVPIDSLNLMVVKALQYAKSLTPNVEAFHVEPRSGEADKLRQKWELLNTDIPLIIKQSPYREVVRPLQEYIASEEHASKPGDIITVLLPQFFVSKWWEMILHNNTSLFIARALFHKRNVVVSAMPFYLEDLSALKRKRLTPRKPGENEKFSRHAERNNDTLS